MCNSLAGMVADAEGAPTDKNMAAGASLKVPHAGSAVLGQCDCQAPIAADQGCVDSAAVHAAGVALAALLQRALQLHTAQGCFTRAP